MSTIFTKIIHREIPADIVYEDNQSLAFLDIKPYSQGHTLLIAKSEYTRMTDAPDTEISHLFVTAKKLMKHMKQELGCEYVMLNVQGEEIPHFHIHLVPVYKGQQIAQRNHITYQPEEKEHVLQALQSYNG